MILVPKETLAKHRMSNQKDLLFLELAHPKKYFQINGKEQVFFQFYNELHLMDLVQISQKFRLTLLFVYSIF